MEFIVELYDPTTETSNGVMPKFHGDDTTTKVTILDEDFPGTLKFADTAITVDGCKTKFVELKLQRIQGSDGKISCIVRSAALTDTAGLAVKNAVEYDDYLPIHEKVQFEHGENEKTIKIELVSVTHVANDENVAKNSKATDGEDLPKPEEDDEIVDVMFRVLIEKPEPKLVKMSRKNVALITISK